MSGHTAHSGTRHPHTGATVQRLAAEVESHIIAHRRALHAIPETGFEERCTAAYVAETLSGLGLPVRTGIATTGVTALLDTGLEGPVVMLRADMDALPVTEATGLPFASRHEGRMHACGHDAHMAMLLGAAEMLSAIVREEPGRLRGKVLFLFQPAEEGPGGAAPMIAEGVLDEPKVDVCLGAHVWPSLPVGTVGVKPGPLMAAMDRFELAVHGRGGHAATPHLCVDALETATQVVGALQRVVSRMTDPLEPVILTIGELHAGTAYNVIPGEARMAGTVRTFSPDVRAAWEDRIRTVADGVCAAMGATATLDFHYCHGPVINTPRVAEVVRRAVVEARGEQAVTTPTPTLGGEDFSCFLERIPGCFFFVGCGGDVPIHNPRFDLDERCLALGAETFVRAALLFTEGGATGMTA
ncbi:M20 family metallopeptidase [Nitratidesulfovibrio vulgaris]|uniref:Peptidase, M20/M25/M40 family n=1 Tax=Nitratidesulfovibrio vulgaris (strain ATCC 29579 / DSM 644 / CCUG 34227 / NCIMB 8303 / VKM B-1760 / Hildenborough) TaxID=882 RepID=Q728N5_NITV2|nr:M20 family metallopeptidase [Nitratidesulfovibrio vulgaris]AAS97040.1 peptidase, M20/M25/M40 family [Nitratidesulfovibrio vulgaris str. Hildenborough]ADP87514.1 amidohydrolase [Nitratidesulfovibrio vulgaris RCH1]